VLVDIAYGLRPSFSVSRPSLRRPSLQTILLEAVEGPELSKIEPGALHERARKQLTRAGIRAAIGGIEASYEAEENRWIIHLHLLVFESLEHGCAQLREAFSDSDLDRAVVCQPLQDLVAQISYLQKFQTYHRPGRRGSKNRGRAYPMKPEQIGQLAQWTRRFRFEDFLFVLGFRRRGERFDPENGFRQALVEARQNAHARGDGGDGGDGPNRHTRDASAPSAPRMSSVTHSDVRSKRLYRNSDSNRAIREDKSRASAHANPGVRRPTVATKSRR
jgi:hypothetical protein